MSRRILTTATVDELLAAGATGSGWVRATSSRRSRASTRATRASGSSRETPRRRGRRAVDGRAHPHRRRRRARLRARRPRPHRARPEGDPVIALYLCPTLHCPHLVQLGAGVLSHLARGGGRAVFRPDRRRGHGRRGARRPRRGGGPGPDGRVGRRQRLLANPTAAVGRMISRFRACADGADQVLVLGSEYDLSLAPVEFSWNTRIAANLGVPMVLVVPSDGGPGQTRADRRRALGRPGGTWPRARRVRADARAGRRRRAGGGPRSRRRRRAARALARRRADGARRDVDRLGPGSGGPGRSWSPT